MSVVAVHDGNRQHSAAAKLARTRNFASLTPAQKKKQSKKKPTIKGLPSDIGLAWAFDDLEFLDIKLPPKADLHSFLTDGSYQRSVDQAPVLELKLSDPTRSLISTDIWKHGSQIRLPPVTFAQARAEKSGNDFTVDYEDWTANILKEPPKGNTVVQAYRDTITRAQFILALVQGAGRDHHVDLKFYCPELTKKQPVGAAAPSKPTTTTRKVSGGGGGFGGWVPQIKGSGATAEQMSVLTTCLAIANQLSAPRLAMLAMVEVLIQENDCTNRPGGGGGSNGAFQLISSTSEQSHINPLDLAACCKAFLTNGYNSGNGGAIGQAKSHPTWSPDAVGQEIQRSGAGAGAYAQWAGEANDIVSHWQGGSGGGSITTSTAPARYAFERKSGESNWDCANRLAKEVNWRFFVVDGWIFYVTDDDLLQNGNRLVISENSPGVDDIDWTLDDSEKVVSKIQVTADITFWDVVTGMVLEVSDSGPANGLWIVTDVSRGGYDTKATITGVLPTKPLPEPAASGGGQSSGGGGAKGGGPSGNAIVDKAYAAAQAIIAKHYPYAWGGGHGTSGVPSLGGYDCSGFVSAVTHAAGVLGSSPLVSGGFESWGQPGKGRIWTIWANGGHVWMEFNFGGGKRYYVGTTNSAPGGGPGQTPYPGDGYASSFVPRHWQGC